MITWAQACEAVGYTDSVRQSRPTRIEIIYAYKAGTVKKFKTMDEAKAYSKTVERWYTEESLKDYKEFSDKMVALEQQASQYWEDALRKEHDELSDEVYDL